MSNIYNSQLDAFELYHRIQEIAAEEHARYRDGRELPALGHAIAGSTAAALSNVFTYPLDVVITRLQTQKSSHDDKSSSRHGELRNLRDALTTVYEREGFLGFYTGILEDTAKTALDSFLFFLLYSYLRKKRLSRYAERHGGKIPSLLPTIDELGIGFISGSLTKLVTTPISNVVTRKQISAMGDASQKDRTTGTPVKAPSTLEIVNTIYSSKGIPGFWSGYTASLILTLNPSLTFFLFEALKRVLLSRRIRDNPPSTATFFLAATSKALASSVTYPISLAKARMQTSSPYSTTIFSTFSGLLQTSGPSSLYSGLYLELTKSFFSHGITMLLKQNIHNTILSLYFYLSHLYSSFKQYLSRSSDPSKSRLFTYLKGKPSQQQGRPDSRTGKDYYDMALSRAGEVAEKAQEKASSTDAVSSGKVSRGKNVILEEIEGLITEVWEIAHETVELVRDYGVGDDDDDGND